jgi:hypothetical protein
MKHVFFITTLCCISVHAADNAQQYTFAYYDDARDHDGV